MSPKAPCKIVAYYRVSTASQGASGLGLEAQQRAVAEYAGRAGCAVVASFEEVESGRRDDRPELVKALAHGKRIGARLVVAKLDRLARSASFLLTLVESGTDVAFCELPDLPTGPAGKFILTMMAGVAELEAGLISHRTRDALAALKARGVKLGASRPGARKLTHADAVKGSRAGASVRRAKAVAKVADLTPQMAAMRAEGLSLAAIAGRLNDAGNAAPEGGRWSAVQVMRALRRVETAG